jgi:hypothetical protein
MYISRLFEKIMDNSKILEILSGKKRKPGPLLPIEKLIVSFIEHNKKRDELMQNELNELLSQCPKNSVILYRYEDTLRTKPKIGSKIDFNCRSFTGAANGGGAALFFNKKIPELGKGLCYAIPKNCAKAGNISEYQKLTKHSMISEEEYLVTGNFKVTKILDKPNTLYLIIQ